MSFNATVWQERFGIPRPEKIICVGRNYRAPRTKRAPIYRRSLCCSGSSPPHWLGRVSRFVLPEGSTHVDVEAELAVVIGSPAARVSRDDALVHVACYTFANDVSARDFQFADGQMVPGQAVRHVARCCRSSCRSTCSATVAGCA